MNTFVTVPIMNISMTEIFVALIALTGIAAFVYVGIQVWRQYNTGVGLCGLGTALTVLALISLLGFGRNYSLCNQWYVDSSQPACADAATWHGIGIIGMVAGLVFLLWGLFIAVSRRDKVR
jgi:hydrogenase-4 membrane subunit HyfE